ncbi:PTS sugar transporter subunit IIB [Salisediminibacterium beveridgei]|uniref:PTS system, lactose/cellobiose specific IIB subunit n=1 Tax=Salisediminibacterium beveridgei TaxID=632773 RepID=A0A1D7QZQ2_9BACI|nr:PTS sugar transporter subunit IIB [Salisediminibacterium beveridgei]AOM84488.1 PTS system, lactose/cellobiose specific IIB subunit [Salisediminibacterium beveridgei]
MYKIVAVCGAGVGSSMMLRVFTEQVIQKHGIEATVDASDIGSINPDEYDIVVTTSDFADRLSTGAAIIRMDNMTDKVFLEEELLKIIK